MIKTSFVEWMKNKQLQEGPLGMGTKIPRRPGVNLNQSLSDSGFDDLSGEEADEASVKKRQPLLAPKFGQRRRPEVFVDPKVLDQLPGGSVMDDLDEPHPESDIFSNDDEQFNAPAPSTTSSGPSGWKPSGPSKEPPLRRFIQGQGSSVPPTHGATSDEFDFDQVGPDVDQHFDTQDDLEAGDTNPSNAWNDVSIRKPQKSWKKYRTDQVRNVGDTHSNTAQTLMRGKLPAWLR